MKHVFVSIECKISAVFEDECVTEKCCLFRVYRNVAFF